jgi:hypothetical protein
MCCGAGAATASPGPRFRVVEGDKVKTVLPLIELKPLTAPVAELAALQLCAGSPGA